MEENKNTKNQALVRDKLMILFSSFAEIILIIMEIYTLINYGSAFIVIAAIALGMIVAMFFLVSGIINMNLAIKEAEHEKYDEIYKAQKASYLIIRKSFEELDERLALMEENSILPADEIISAQKAVAKVTINKSKENTEAIVSSNDELVNKLYSFEQKLEALTNAASNSNNADVRTKEMSEMSYQLESMKRQLDEMQIKLAAGIPVQQVQPIYMQAPSVQGMPVAQPMPEPQPAPVQMSEPVLEPEAVPEPELIQEPEPILEPEPEPVIEPEPIPEPEPVPAFVPSDDPNKPMSPDDIAALLASMQGGLGSVEEVAAEEPEPEPEPVPEEPAVVPVPDVGVDLSDPGRVMSPEEIEKLFASL